MHGRNIFWAAMHCHSSIACRTITPSHTLHNARLQAEDKYQMIGPLYEMVKHQHWSGLCSIFDLIYLNKNGGSFCALERFAKCYKHCITVPFFIVLGMHKGTSLSIENCMCMIESFHWKIKGSRSSMQSQVVSASRLFHRAVTGLQPSQRQPP